MRVLLFNNESGEYFQASDCWTSDPFQAMDFGGTVRAAQAVFEHRLRQIEIVLAFDDAHVSNLHVPLSHAS